jgi:hypothetical protein
MTRARGRGAHSRGFVAFSSAERVAASGLRASREKKRFDYGGSAVFLLALSIVLSAFFAKVIDGSRLIIDVHGTGTLIENGNTGGLVGVGLMLLAAAVAAFGMLSIGRQRPVPSPFSLAMVVLVGWWVVASTLLQGDVPTASDAVTMTSAIAVMVGVVVAPPTLRTARHLDLLRDVTALGLLAYALIAPDLGQLPCRPDKCGLFDSLLVGFVLHENTAAALIALLIPLIVVQRSLRRSVTSVLISSSLVLATGSRTAMVILVISLVFIPYARHKLGLTGAPHLAWRVLPLITFLVSTALFLFASPTALTGRGLLYWAMREQLHGFALVVGSGSETMERAALFMGGFTAIGEHGQAPHLLVLTGVVGWTHFAVALTALAMTRTWTPRRHAALGLAIAAGIQGISEPGWLLEVRTSGFLTAVLAVGLMCSAGSRALTPAQTTRGTVRSEIPNRP